MIAVAAPCTPQPSLVTRNTSSSKLTAFCAMPAKRGVLHCTQIRLNTIHAFRVAIFRVNTTEALVSISSHLDVKFGLFNQDQLLTECLARSHTYFMRTYEARRITMLESRCMTREPMYSSFYNEKVMPCNFATCLTCTKSLYCFDRSTVFALTTRIQSGWGPLLTTW